MYGMSWSMDFWFLFLLWWAWTEPESMFTVIRQDIWSRCIQSGDLTPLPPAGSYTCMHMTCRKTVNCQLSDGWKLGLCTDSVIYEVMQQIQRMNYQHFCVRWQTDNSLCVRDWGPSMDHHLCEHVPRISDTYSKLRSYDFTVSFTFHMLWPLFTWSFTWCGRTRIRVSSDPMRPWGLAD